MSLLSSRFQRYRLAKTEEAVSSIKEMLARIDEKISRILIRGR